jgi:dihydroorotase
VTPQHLIINRNAHVSPAGFGRTLMPAGRKARAAPPASAQPRPRHLPNSSSAPTVRRTAVTQGIRVRLRRHLQRALCAGKLCGRVRGGGRPGPFRSFASENGPRFYGLPLNDRQITLEWAETAVPAEVEGLVPFHAGETLRSRFVG